MSVSTNVKILVLVLVLSVPALGQQLTGYVLSAERHRSHGVTSSYNSQTGAWSHGVASSRVEETDIQIGDKIYEIEHIFKNVEVGKDYPVAIVDGGKKIQLTVDGKVQTQRISGVREISAPAK